MVLPLPRANRDGTVVGVLGSNGGLAQVAPSVLYPATGKVVRLLQSYSASRPVVSADGRYAAYIDFHLAGCLRCGNITVKNLGTGATELVSVSAAGAPSRTGRNGLAAISADGRHVAFVSNGTDLVAGATTVRWRVYVRDLDSKRTQLVSSDATDPSLFRRTGNLG